ISSIVDKINAAAGDAENKLYNTVKATYSNGVLTIKVAADADDVAFSDMNVGLGELLSTTLKNGGYESIKLTEINEAEGAGVGKSEIDKLITDKDTISAAIRTFLGTLNSGPASKLSDIIAKSFTVEFAIQSDVVNKASQNKYTVKFISEVNTDEIIRKNVSSNTDYALTCAINPEGNCTLGIEVKTATKAIGTTDNLGLKTIITKLLEKTDLVKSVKLVYGANEIEVSSSALIDSAISSLFSNGKYGDLISKKLTITVILNAENAVSQNGNSSETYAVDVIANVNTDKDFAVATGGLTIGSTDAKGSYEEGTDTIYFDVQTDTASVNNLNSYLEKIDTLLATKLYKSATVSYGTTKAEVTSTVSAATDLAKVLTAMAGKDSGAQLKDLIGKTINVSFELLNDGVKNAGKYLSYKIAFVTAVNTDTSTETLFGSSSVSQFKNEKPINVEENKKATTKYIVELNSANLTDELSTVANSLKTTLQAEAKKYASIKINYNNASYTINYKNDVEETYGELDSFVSALSTGKVSSLAGKTMTITYTLLSNGINQGTGLEYTVEFTNFRTTAKEVKNYVDSLSSMTNLKASIDEQKNTIKLDVKKPSDFVKNILGTGQLDLKTKIVAAFKTGAYKSITFKLNGTDYVVTYTAMSDLTTESIIGLDKFIEALGGEEATLISVANKVKTLTVTFNLNDGYKAVTGEGTAVKSEDIIVGDPTYTIDFSKVVDTTEMVKAAFTEDSNAHLSFDKNDIKVLYYNGTTNVDNTLVGKFVTKLLAPFKGATADERIAKITVAVGEQGEVTFEKTNASLLNDTEVNKELRTKLAAEAKKVDPTKNGTVTQDNLTSANLKGVTLTITIDLVDGSAISQNGITTEKYNVVIVGESAKVANAESTFVQSVNEASGKVLSLKSDGHSYTATVLKSDATEGTGLLAALAAAKLNTLHIEKVTIGTVVVNTSSLNPGTLKTDLLKYLEGLTGLYENEFTVGALIGKTINIKLEYADGYYSEDGNTTENYTVSFVAPEE
ncbi:hypothetical protein, partial [Mammaliicoccus vitulinus]|uniref:hypothetical protein n=1 Tax=Mammaliicoccus vitulinus TaxID=71237 RepID=UPI00248C634A